MHCKMKPGLKPRILAKRQGFSGKDLGRILGLLAKVNPPKTPGSWPRECPQDPKILEPLGQDCWPKIPRLRCKILAKMFPLGCALIRTTRTAIHGRRSPAGNPGNCLGRFLGLHILLKLPPPPPPPPPPLPLLGTPPLAWVEF